MPITADHIRTTVTAYLDRHPQEKAGLAELLGLLDAGADLTSRKEFRGHATAGAVLVDDEGDALLVHHLSLGRWLTPGGHLEPGDATLAGAALRELAEETGVGAEGLVLTGEGPIRIDVHPIPANPARREADHQHFDFRFLVRTAGHHPVTPQQEEGDAAAWRSAAELSDPVLRARVLATLN